MGATLHVGWALVISAAVCICLAKFGRRPADGWWPVSCLLMALVIAVLGFAGTVAGSREGTRSENHFFLYFIGSWLLLTFIEPKKRAALLTLGLVLCVLCHRIEYMRLAISSGYTDNPKYRLEMIGALNNSRREKGLMPQQVEVQRGWHTWLTDLYEVKPPTGGVFDFRPPDNSPGKTKD